MIKSKTFKILDKQSIKSALFSRQDIQKAIWQAQGHKLSAYKNRQGYYADAIQDWCFTGLIKRVEKGWYRLTEDGHQYANNRKEWLKKRRKERAQTNERLILCKNLGKAYKSLVGRRIKSVDYLTPQQTSNMGWNQCPIKISFTDGSYIIPQSDDEGNEGGALLIYEEPSKWDVIGTI